jgi:hypothetical protein
LGKAPQVFPKLGGLANRRVDLLPSHSFKAKRMDAVVMRDQYRETNETKPTIGILGKIYEQQFASTGFTSVVLAIIENEPTDNLGILG